MTGMASKEGEEVNFIAPVSTKEHPRINEWLTAVEHQMRVSLATAMSKACETIRNLFYFNFSLQTDRRTLTC